MYSKLAKSVLRWTGENELQFLTPALRKGPKPTKGAGGYRSWLGVASIVRGMRGSSYACGGSGLTYSDRSIT